MWGRLTVIDAEAWLYVALEADPDDWVARFEKAHDFPAHEWAERMVALHNSALRESHHPEWRRGVEPPAERNAPFNPRRTSTILAKTEFNSLNNE